MKVTYLNLNECCLFDKSPEQIGEMLVDASPGKDGKKLVMVLSEKDRKFLENNLSDCRDVGDLLHKLICDTIKKGGSTVSLLNYTYHESGLFTINS